MIRLPKRERRLAGSIVLCWLAFSLSLGCASVAKITEDVCRIAVGGSKAEVICDKAAEWIMNDDEEN